MFPIRTAFDRLKHPEHTGANRCIPCTVVNLFIAVSTSLLLTGLSTWLAGATLLLSVVIIYFRGYLVPGTPTLTRHYFPPWLLRAFNKRPTETDSSVLGTDLTDPERFLREAGIITDCTTGGDVCLNDDFDRVWKDHITTLRHNESIQRDVVRTLYGSEGAVVAIEEYETKAPLLLGSNEPVRTLVATIEGDQVGMWDSRAAFIADIAAATELKKRYPEWFDVDNEVCNGILKTLRAFLDSCPICGGKISISVRSDEGCCGGQSIVQATCEKCEDLLFEVAEDHQQVTV